MIKWAFIILTLVKAGYIVLSFMHLGDERKNFRYMISRTLYSIHCLPDLSLIHRSYLLG